MQLLFLSTLLAALAMPTAALDAGEYNQCGGKSWTPANCTAGFGCAYATEYYSQCLPLPVETDKYVPRYSQCGGEGWTGLTTCTAGSYCQASDKHYSQCRPISEMPSRPIDG
ncbi:hypothetical protein SPRG_09801 [Saprolegnia parasitica CBS 223.65]|uniref:CBM1 domain-containing protein n=1 Tax=Saprolegnia parasitica (strain CBS 223.65) TaxID=695850 RepID=A0A067CCY8_SAPPC|nr:hypothetical protein SPRG_09801 [Saprolegnia parasitica CBS 223.65]KDO24411.1 hypothetical protein SPRG_09801 [Saprolegnia parasitica CBS 223.65]|eukprot:XP_012204841.1 hypothetical protein SPRG_09801 [Saprolegnia parasitica CBS 223.65]